MDREIYKGFFIEKRTIRGEDGFIVTAQGKNIMPHAQKFDSRGEARAITDIFLSCGGSPFGQDPDWGEFEARLGRVNDMRRDI